MRFRLLTGASVLLLVVAALAMSACGSSDKKKSSTNAAGGQPAALSLTIAESGKAARYTAPASTKGGLVTVTLVNKGKMPHAAQLVRVTGNHTLAEAIKTIGSNSDKTPAWIRGEGGVTTVGPGQTGTATLILPAGKYALVDSGGPGSGPPATTSLTVTAGASGSLPSTPLTITAAAPSKDHFKWDIKGTLKPGDNRLTFVSKGKDTIHFLGAFRVTGNPSEAAIKKALKSQGKPPPFLDQTSFTETAVLDSGKSEVVSLNLRKPGQYVLFCPLKDRDGGKSHDQEGLLTKVTVK